MPVSRLVQPSPTKVSTIEAWASSSRTISAARWSARAGRDVDDLDQAGRRMVAAEPQRPARLAGEAAERVAGSTSIADRDRVRVAAAREARRRRTAAAALGAQSSHGSVVRRLPASARARPAPAAPKGRSSARPRPGGREGRARSRRHLPIAFALELVRRARRRPSGRSGRRRGHGRNRARRCRAAADNG